MSIERLQEIIEPETETIVSELIEKYFYENSLLDTDTIGIIKRLLHNIVNYTIIQNPVELKQNYQQLTELSIRSNIPYVVLINELEFIKNKVINLLLEKEAKEEVYEICTLYRNCHNTIAYSYLIDYLGKLVEKNNKRLLQLRDLISKEIIVYYEAHLNWLNQLVLSVKHFNTAEVPETDPTRCTFGKWLSEHGKKVIRNASTCRELMQQHDTLHYLSHKIEKKLQHGNLDYHIFISYLEKAELLSLEIGTHLALVDNTLLVQKSTKDKLTGAISRNSLDTIFLNQYELAFATEKSFVIAMCDLDNFKQINDTYGHVAGDKLLEHFASIAMGKLRASDIIIRYGGEEFLIILPAITEDKGVIVLNDIRKSLEESSIEHEGKKITATVSIGMIGITPPSDIKNSQIHLEHYIQAADEKLYLAKHSGRNCLKY